MYIIVLFVTFLFVCSCKNIEHLVFFYSVASIEQQSIKYDEVITIVKLSGTRMTMCCWESLTGINNAF